MLGRTVASLALACATAAIAQPASSSSGSAAAAVDLRAWLTRIHDASSRKNFQGTFFVSGGGSVTSARIAHFAEGGHQYERIESLDGRQRKVFRVDDAVLTVWPGSHVAMLEQRGFLTSFPALLQGEDARLADWYEVRAEGVQRVADHEADVLHVRPRDAWRYGYRLWADRATGLLLRSDTLGERGDVLETTAFSDVAIGVRGQSEAIAQAMRRVDGYRVVRPTLVPTRLEDEGWAMRPVAPGFVLVRCLSRRIDAPDAPADPSGVPVVQAIWSDGLTYVSLFIEPYRSERHAEALLAALGATLTLTQRQGDFWITVVGEVPRATLKTFAAALERKRR